jgi:hypothetical protein
MFAELIGLLRAGLSASPLSGFLLSMATGIWFCKKNENHTFRFSYSE